MNKRAKKTFKCATCGAPVRFATGRDGTLWKKCTAADCGRYHAIARAQQTQLKLALKRATGTTSARKESIAREQKQALATSTARAND